jgi:hypothetical protein
MTKAEEKSQRDELLLAIILAHKFMARFLDRSALAPARRVHELAVGQLVSGLRKLLKGNTRSAVRGVLAQQVRDFITKSTAEVGIRVNGILQDVSREASSEAAMLTEEMIQRVNGTNVPVFDPKRAVQLELVRQTVFLEFHASMNRVLATSLEDSITKRLNVIPAADLKGSDVVAEAGVGLDDAWWKVESAVRTTASTAYNAAMTHIVRDLTREPELQDLRLRWTELVDDATGKPMDDRVGADSIALHGQVARPGRLFVMPPNAKVDAYFIGKAWPHPPNRRWDRSMLNVYSPSWRGVPAYSMESGSRVSL